MTVFTIGTVYLNVASLDRQIAFYEDIIGLQVHDRSEDTARLGVGAHDLLVMTETPDYEHQRGTTGLYHFAILVPTRVQLANSLQRIAETRTGIQGLSDHIVSEAIYLPDPEGNGIEIYWDRPRDAWYRDGQMQLDTLPLDVTDLRGELTAQNAVWQGLPSGTIIGHIHLHVADVPESEVFYRDVLGMDVMFNVGSATFMAYDNYHHHVGANIWGGRRISGQPQLGLSHYDLHLSSAAQLDAVLDMAARQGVTVTHAESHHRLSDPSGNRIALHS